MQLALGDLGDLEDGGPARPWYKRWGFWLSALSFAASLAFFVAGIVMVVVSPDTVRMRVCSCVLRVLWWHCAAHCGCMPLPASTRQQEVMHVAA